MFDRPRRHPFSKFLDFILRTVSCRCVASWQYRRRGGDGFSGFRAHANWRSLGARKRETPEDRESDKPQRPIDEQRLPSSSLSVHCDGRGESGHGRRVYVRRAGESRARGALSHGLHEVSVEGFSSTPTSSFAPLFPFFLQGYSTRSFMCRFLDYFIPHRHHGSMANTEIPGNNLKKQENFDSPSSSSESLPRTFGRLTLLRRVARGGMGEVYLAATRGIEGAERACVVKK